MDPSNIHQQALLQLLQRTRLPEQEVEARLEKARDPSYWKDLNPHLPLGGAVPPETFESASLDGADLQTLVSRYAREGHFQAGPLLASSVMEGLRDCVEVLRKADWPPVFAFLYDPLWLVTRTPSLRRLLDGVLGAGYRQTSHVWCHYVRPGRGQGGWPPHVDGHRQGKRITVWIPLTDATLDNGCIYLIPRDLIASETAEAFIRTEAVGFSELAELLQGSRALPARAGSVLGWDYPLIHWGAKCARPGEPRISVAVAFLGADTEHTTREPPLIEGGTLPGFSQRLQLIGKAIETYQRREPWMIRYQELGQRLLQ